MITEEQKLKIVHKLMEAVAVYTRFISEADQAGAFHAGMLSKISGEMNVPEEELKELVEQSTLTFDEMKKALNEEAEILAEIKS